MLKKNLIDFTYLVRRNMKIFYLDKVSFLSSLITPFILVFLYITFLKNVYDKSLLSVLAEFNILSIPDNLKNGFSAGWLISSIMATTCVTLTFCGNTIVVSDKLSGANKDIEAAPVSRMTIYLSYFVANFLSTFFVALIALGLGFIYIGIVGWYLSFIDVVMLTVSTVLLTLFGSLFASIIMSFFKSQGAITASSIIVSALYGFVCGAYMPISSFSPTVSNIIYCLPGTYGTMGFRHFFCHGALDELEKYIVGVADSQTASLAVSSIKKGFDIEITAFGNTIDISQAILILSSTIIVLLISYSLIIYFKNFKKKTVADKLKR